MIYDIIDTTMRWGGQGHGRERHTGIPTHPTHILWSIVNQSSCLRLPVPSGASSSVLRPSVFGVVAPADTGWLR